MKLTILGKLLQKGNTFEPYVDKRSGKARIRHTDEYKALKEYMAWQTKAQRKGKQFTGPVLLLLTIYYPTMAHDLDESMIMDALEDGGAYANDRQVYKKWSEKFKDKDNPRIEVGIYPADPEPLMLEVIGGVFKVVE